jgi:Carboxypeptidase regulatory-like domain/TonB-dependent Receptor Plug Domain
LIKKCLRRCSILSVALLFSFALSAAGQETTGSISGTVSDSSGAVIKGAIVTLTNTDRGAIVRTLTTSSAGFYTGTSLPLGTYTVQVSDNGFKTAVVTDLVLHANDALTVNRTLIPGGATETVSVTADEAQLNLENATSAGLINGDQLNELVLNGRNYETFLQLQPGVVYGNASTDQLYVGSTAPGGASNQVNFSVNGGRNTSNNWTVDGADNVDRGANLTLLTFPSADAIAEVKTLRGQYSAEFGRSASGQINVITKSGTNAFHGTLYEFLRNDALNANAWGSKLVVPFTPRTKLRYNDFGGTIGGPVWIPHLYNGHGKTFFFFSDEARRFVQYSTGTNYVPTAAERLGDFTNAYYAPAGSTLASAQGPVAVCTAYSSTNGTCTTYGSKVANISPTAAAYLKDLYSIIPLPPSTADLAAGLDPHVLIATVPNIFNDNQIIVRVDQAVGQKLNVFYRYIHDTFPLYLGTGGFVTSAIPGVSATIEKNPGTEQLGHATYVFSPTLLADVGYAYSTNGINQTPIGAFTTANSPDVKPTLPFVNTLGVIPTLSFTGTNALTSLGSSGIYNDYNRNHNAFGNVTKTWGRNTIIMGATYDHYQKQENATGGNQGGFTFAINTGVPAVAGLNTASQTDLSFANFLLGNANSGFSQASTAITVNIQESVLEAFVQDNWKIAPRLSLNVGLRYGYYGQPTDADGRINNFDPDTYKPSLAPTIDSTGLICFVAPCKNADALNSGLPNTGEDYNGINYINGMIFGVPSAANNNQASPFGSKIGQADNKNLAPRVGFAFDVFGDGKTGLRGGYGWSYDESEVSYYETAVFNNPPAVTSYSLSTAVLDNPAGGSGTTTQASTTPGRVVASPIHYNTPYVQQYSLDVQQMITPTFMLDVGFFGTHGTHLIGLLDINEPTPNSFAGKLSPTDVSSTCVYTGTTTPAFISTTCDRGLNQIKPYIGYFAIDAVRSIFSSNYSALQVKATKRFAGASFVDLNYTWSRDLTNNQNDYSTPPQNTYNINGDYGRAADDRTDVISVDGVWELPWMKDQRGVVGHLVGGWEASGILVINSGLPLTVSESSGGLISYGYTSVINGQTTGGYANDAAGIGVLGNTNAGLRPNMIGDPNNGYGQKIHNHLQWFYRGAFAAPLPGSGQVGNEKRGVVEGPGFNHIDLGLFRNFKIHEAVNFQFRAEAYNALNHTNLLNPGTTSTSSSSFGIITGARDNRVLQIAGKLRF